MLFFVTFNVFAAVDPSGAASASSEFMGFVVVVGSLFTAQKRLCVGALKLATE